MDISQLLLSAQHIEELERRKRLAESLRSTLTVLNSSLPLEKILSHIVNQACSLLDADAAIIYRLQLDGTLAVQAAGGLEKQIIERTDIPLGGSAAGRAVFLQNATPYGDIADLLRDLRNEDPDILRAIRHLAGEYRSLLVVPLVVRAENYGSLALFYTYPRQFSEEDIKLAKDFCLQAALAIENARLREETERKAVTAERNRLAQELHDSVTQMLFSANLIADVLPNIWQRDSKQGMEGLNELHQLTRGALAEMRSLLLELRPRALEEARLKDLLRQLAESISGRIRQPVKLEIDGQAIIPQDVRLAYYRIAQEALNNIVKHTEADQIAIVLNCEPAANNDQCRLLEMTITDNGCGFDQASVETGRFGLNIIRERAQAIGAALEIESRKDCGTRIAVTWQTPEDKSS